jgi:hypothetical protein
VTLVTLLPAKVAVAEKFERAFATITKAKSDAPMVPADRPFLFSHRERIVKFAG